LPAELVLVAVVAVVVVVAVVFGEADFLLDPPHPAAVNTRTTTITDTGVSLIVDASLTAFRNMAAADRWIVVPLRRREQLVSRG
jgi:hypothetical protein